MKAIFLVGTSHEAYQIRPKSAPQDGADAFKRYVQKAVRTYAVQSIAEEMSAQALNDRHTVCQEVADENNLSHILCDPTCSERQSLGISKDNTSDDNMKREKEWLHRLVVQSCKYPALFVCGANHVCSFAQLCQNYGLVPTILNNDFEAPEIPFDRRIL